MAKAGFIHDKLDIKFLVLYLMARVASPVDFSTLADLTFCDDGVEYFDFAAALAELVDTGHLELKDDKYSITEKGRRNGKICEPVRGASLVGTGAEVIQKIDMVGRQLDLGQGMCGSSSGSVPVNVGQPMIRVSSITVGGR